MQQLLLDSIAAPEDGRRLAAVHWAGKLYGFSDVPARYIGVLAAGDAKLEVREAGLASLQPPKAPKGVLQAHACRRWQWPSCKHCGLLHWRSEDDLFAVIRCKAQPARLQPFLCRLRCRWLHNWTHWCQREDVAVLAAVLLCPSGVHLGQEVTLQRSVKGWSV